MGTVPTGMMERELRKLYRTWVSGLPEHEAGLDEYIGTFEKKSKTVIEKFGGRAASYGAFAGFPAPKRLELDPVVDYIYDEMRQAAVTAGIVAGLNAKVMARAMLNGGMDKSYRKLERFARTETVRAYWNNSWDSAEGLDLVMVWSSEHGPRTCQYCDSRDGLVVEDRSIRDHPNGRCTLLPMLASRVKYKGTLQPDGSVTMDPTFAKSKVAGAKASKSAGPTTEAQRDPLSGKANPAAPSKVATSVAKAPAPVSANPLSTAGRTSVTPPTNPRIIKSVKDMQDFGKNMPTPSSLSAGAADLVDGYAKGTAYGVNAALRKQKTFRGGPVDARTKAYSKKFTKEMDKMMDASLIPEDVRVVRALGADSFGGIDELQKLAGKVYSDKGYMSTSLAEKTSSAIYNVADAVDMEIVVPKGTRALYMAGESYLKSERELLLDRGTQLAVQSVTYDERKKKWKLIATVIPGPR